MLEEVASMQSALAEKQAAFEAEQAIVANANANIGSIVGLDVGGAHLTTTRTTLTSVPGSMLEALFSGRHQLDLDKNGRVFIDRDGETFKQVLKFFRSPQSFVWPESAREIAELHAEFDYFGLRVAPAAQATMPLVVLSVMPRSGIQVAGLMVVLQVKVPLCIMELRTAVGNEAHGKRFRVFSKVGTYQDACQNRGPEGWALVHDKLLCLDPDSPDSFQTVCKGLDLSLDPGWHTLYLHGDTSDATESEHSAIGVTGPAVQVGQNSMQVIACDEALEVYPGCNTNDSEPWALPDDHCLKFVGEISYKRKTLSQ